MFSRSKTICSIYIYNIYNFLQNDRVQPNTIKTITAPPYTPDAVRACWCYTVVAECPTQHHICYIASQTYSMAKRRKYIWMNRLSIYEDELESVSKLLLGRCEVRIVLFDILNMYFLWDEIEPTYIPPREKKHIFIFVWTALVAQYGGRLRKL